MPAYQTEAMKRLKDGMPYFMEMSAEEVEQTQMKINRMKDPKHDGHFLPKQERLELFECSLFPCYKKIVRVFGGVENGLPLLREILVEFDLPEEFIEKLLADEKYVADTCEWFEGICGDGERAARTIRFIHKITAKYFSADADTSLRLWE